MHIGIAIAVAGLVGLIGLCAFRAWHWNRRWKRALNLNGHLFEASNDVPKNLLPDLIRVTARLMPIAHIVAQRHKMKLTDFAIRAVPDASLGKGSIGMIKGTPRTERMFPWTPKRVVLWCTARPDYMEILAHEIAHDACMARTGQFGADPLSQPYKDLEDEIITEYRKVFR